MTRNRYVDLVRVGAIGIVVIGHWIDTIVERGDGVPRPRLDPIVEETALPGRAKMTGFRKDRAEAAG